MLSYFMESISKIGIFILCAQVLIHFRPKASYEKYLKMLVSAMILVQLFAPVGNLFSEGGEQDFGQRMAEFEQELSQSLDRIKPEPEVFSMQQEVPAEEMENGAHEGGTVPRIAISGIGVDPISIHVEKGGGENAEN